MSSSVLETFYYLFKSDASDVKKGADEAEKHVKNLKERLTDTDAVSKKLGHSFLDMAKQAGEALVAIFAVGQAIHGVINAEEDADKLGLLAKRIGENVTNLDAWGHAVKAAGGDAESFNQSLTLLAANMAMVDVKGTSRVKPFFDEIHVQMLDGVGKVRKALDVLPEIAQAFEKMTPQASEGFGRKMGLDEGTIQLLQKGRKAVEELVLEQKKARLVTEEDTRVAREYNEALDEQELAARGLALSIGAEVMPVLTDLFHFFRDNKEMIENFFIGIAAVVTAYYIPAMTRAAIAGALAVAPWLPLIAILAALGAAFALVADDVDHFLKGQPSALGYVVKWWNDLLGAIKDVIAALAGGAQWLNNKLGLTGLADANVHHSVALAQGHINTAASSPIGSQTSNSITNSSSRQTHKTTHVSVGEVVVNTQATNADEMAAHASGALTKELRQVVNDSDDGVAG